MLAVVPKSWCSWDFRLEEPVGKVIGEVRLSSWRERGAVVVGGVDYKIYRDGWRGPFVLEAPDASTVATAVKPSALRREFVVSDREERYVLKASGWGRELRVFRGDTRIGSIVRESWLRRRASVKLRDDMPIVLRAFAVWLAVLLWKRDSDAAST